MAGVYVKGRCVRLISSQGGVLQFSSAGTLSDPAGDARLVTGLEAVDALLPAGGFATGAVHEIIGTGQSPPTLFPLLIARAASITPGRWVVWADAGRTLYPPGLAAMGLPLDRLIVLRPADARSTLWATAQCLRTRAVGACVAPVQALTRTEARKLQLAAEQGGGIGILLRPTRALRAPYAAATRWVVRPERGERTLHRFSVELIHGHGGRVGHPVTVEVCRETNHVRSFDQLADRPHQPKAVPTWA